MHIYSEEIELQKSITLEFRRKVKNQVENPALGEKPGKSLKINSRIFLEIIQNRYRRDLSNLILKYSSTFLTLND